MPVPTASYAYTENNSVTADVQMRTEYDFECLCLEDTPAVKHHFNVKILLSYKSLTSGPGYISRDLKSICSEAGANRDICLTWS